ncbi:MAG: radical SAM protein [Myxococcales bacterium]
MKLTLFLDHACNLRCSYCYTGEKKPRKMPVEVAQKAIDFGLAQVEKGWLLLALFGGEPLLDVELAERSLEYAARVCRNAGVRLFTTLATNGTLLDDRRVELLKRYNFHVQLSLDGSLEAQDACRRFADGRSSHAVIVDHLARLLSEGFAPVVLSVIDPANVDHLADSFDFLLEAGATNVHFSPNYTASWDEAAWARFESALHRLGERYLFHTRAGREFRLDPLHGKIVTHLLPGSNETVICKFGQGDVAVAPSGRIYPCERLVGQDDREALCIGHLDTVLDTARVQQFLAGREQDDPECAECEYKGRCKRWCGCANFETTGDPNKTSPLVCAFETAFIEEADRIAGTLFEEKNPTFLKRYYVPKPKAS